MQVPNSLSQIAYQVKNSIYHRQNEFEEAAIREELAQNALNFMKGTDPRIIAYLWMAIEQNKNILLLNEKKSDCAQIIDTLSLLVPSFYTVQEISNPLKTLDKRANFVVAARPPNMSIKRQLVMAEKLMPDRLILRGRSNSCFGDILELSKLGISFIASLEGEFDNVLLMKKLKSITPKMVHPKLKGIDISMHTNFVNGVPQISKLTEYSWLEKGEILLKNYEFIAKPYKCTRLLDNRTLGMKEIQKSKILTERKDSSLIELSDVLEDLDKRAQFIRSINEQYISEKGINFMEYYYELN